MDFLLGGPKSPRENPPVLLVSLSVCSTRLLISEALRSPETASWLGPRTSTRFLAQLGNHQKSHSNPHRITRNPIVNALNLWNKSKKSTDHAMKIYEVCQCISPFNHPLADIIHIFLHHQRWCHVLQEHLESYSRNLKMVGWNFLYTIMDTSVIFAHAMWDYTKLSTINGHIFSPCIFFEICEYSGGMCGQSAMNHSHSSTEQMSSGMWGINMDDCTKTRDKRVSHPFVGTYWEIRNVCHAVLRYRFLWNILWSCGKFPGVIFIKDENADVELALQRPGTGALIVVAHPTKGDVMKTQKIQKNNTSGSNIVGPKILQNPVVHDYDQILIRIPMVTLCWINKDPENKHFWVETNLLNPTGIRQDWSLSLLSSFIPFESSSSVSPKRSGDLMLLPPLPTNRPTWATSRKNSSFTWYGKDGTSWHMVTCHLSA